MAAFQIVLNDRGRFTGFFRAIAFLTLWKDADPDIPILIAAKQEYAKLR